jgi:hypothetical protein
MLAPQVVHDTRAKELTPSYKMQWRYSNFCHGFCCDLQVWSSLKSRGPLHDIVSSRVVGIYHDIFRLRIQLVFLVALLCRKKWKGSAADVELAWPFGFSERLWIQASRTEDRKHVDLQKPGCHEVSSFFQKRLKRVAFRSLNGWIFVNPDTNLHIISVIAGDPKLVWVGEIFQSIIVCKRPCFDKGKKPGKLF